jgi:hypothetical protein
MPETTSPSPAIPDPPRRRWAEHELGALLARAWLEADAEAPAAETPAAETRAAETPAAETPAAETPAAESLAAGPQPSGSGTAWEVVRVPSEAEGGIFAMLVAGHTSPGDSSPGDSSAGANGGAGSADGERAGAGRAALSEMLDRLPVEPLARLTPDDVDVEALAPAPPGVWLWGDDDIYPDGASGSARQRKRAS